MIENIETLTIEYIRERVHELKSSGFRFVTMTACTNPDETVDLIYAFDLKGKLVTLKTTVATGSEVKSVSDIYLAAAFVENEISELFGLKFSGLAVDYGGHFMLAEGAPNSPFGPNIIIERKGGNGNAG